MYTPFHYLLFRLKSKNEYSIHSPFLFNLYTHVLTKDRHPLKIISMGRDIRYLLKKREIIESPYPFQDKGSLPQSYLNMLHTLTKTLSFTQLLSIYRLSDSEPVHYRLYSHSKDKNIYNEILNTTDIRQIKKHYHPFEYIIMDNSMLSYEYISSLFQEILTCTTSKTILIIKGIHSSDSILTQWKSLTHNTEVTLSLDLFFMGILFFNTKLSKQDWKLKI